MSDCGNCDCADRTKCVKKGSSYVADFVETEKSYTTTIVMDVPAAAENDGCKCGTSCACVDCTCGGH
ncbi:hypothetical protein Pint_04565 [Pistacia integerrima]|uniref:Uncharacterized protein n=2 Tax=Pistacia TaxID=55512 RepID=A0ACC1BXJ1_9ROSI|nr:hypothetical protein Pint_04565 [Pistacia integerrima]KAJ0103710.1 hypothetical protein Patl1_04670 [Pistacia atlantica]